MRRGRRSRPGRERPPQTAGRCGRGDGLGPCLLLEGMPRPADGRCRRRRPGVHGAARRDDDAESRETAGVVRDVRHEQGRRRQGPEDIRLLDANCRRRGRVGRRDRYGDGERGRRRRRRRCGGGRSRHRRGSRSRCRRLRVRFDDRRRCRYRCRHRCRCRCGRGRCRRLLGRGRLRSGLRPGRRRHRGRLGGRRRRRGRGRGLRGRRRRHRRGGRRHGRRPAEQAERVDVALLVRVRAHAEVDVRPLDLGRAARADRADRVTLGDRRALGDVERAEMRQRDVVAVAGEDRQRPPARGDGSREGDGAARGRDDRAARGRADVDAPVLAARVRVRGVERERREHRAVHRPRPGTEQGDAEQEEQSDETHAGSPFVVRMENESGAD